MSRRRTEQLIESAECHVDALATARRAVLAYGSLGYVTPQACEFLMSTLDTLDATFRPVLSLALVIDNGARIVGALIDTWSVNAWVGRLTREASQDETRLEHDGLLPALGAD